MDQLILAIALGLLVAALPASDARGRRVPGITGDDLKGSADILSAFGYPYERHNCLTEDGYILQVDRIPNPGRPPVYVANPLFGAAPVYLNLGPNYGLGFLLHDSGYDVWMSSVRGTAYSKDHLRLKKEDPEYWNFGVYEHGVYDHPACIDMVLKKTGYRQLFYVGFSMGSTTFLIMTSVRPEYNKKVKAAFLMAPVTSLYYSDNLLVKVLKAAVNASEGITDRFSPAFPHALVRKFGQDNCRGPQRRVCNALWLRLNNDPNDEDIVGDNIFFLETFPAGGSFRTLYQVAQFTNAPGWFKPYSFSVAKNKKIYGQSPPPNYPLQRITTPLYVYASESDALLPKKDFENLLRQLRSVVKLYTIPDPTFSHLTYIFSKRSRIVYAELLSDMASFYNKWGLS